MDRSIQLKTAQEQYVTKCRDRYEQKWVELASLEQSLKGLPLNVPAKEIEKVFHNVSITLIINFLIGQV